MSEIKQLLMNGFFKKILLFIFFSISTALIAFFNHDKWLQYKSWILIFLCVALFQVIFFGVIKLSKWMPWKKCYKRVHAIFVEKTVDSTLSQDMERIKNDFKQVLNARNKIKLPFYICFESNRDIVVQAIKASGYEEASIKHSNDKITLVLSEKAVFCILSSELLKAQESLWLGFLKFVKRNSRHFSSISVLIFVKNRDDICNDLGKWLKMCRCKIEDMSKLWNQFIPSHGISYQSMGLQGFEQFLKDGKESSQKMLKLDISALSGDAKKAGLSNFFQAIAKKWTVYRFFAIEKLNSASDKWEHFIFPGLQEGFFEQLSSEWGKIVQDTPFNTPSSMRSLYFIESYHSEKMLWQDLMKSTSDLEKRKITKEVIYYSMMMKVNIGFLIIGFFIFLVWNILHIRHVSHFVSLRDRLNHAVTMIENKLIEEEKIFHKNNGAFSDLKLLLTLGNQSPETVEKQIFLITEWFENQKIIDKNEVPEVKLLLADYFKHNNGKWLPGLTIERPIVQKIQNRLNGVSPVKYFLAQLESMEKQVIFPQGTMDLIEVRSLIPKLYTTEGWEQTVEPLIQLLVDDAERDNWVFGGKTKSNTIEITQHSPNLLKIALKEAYLTKYRKNWEKFFHNISLKSFLNTYDASVKLGILLGPEGAWINLLNFIIKNMDPLKTPALNQKNNASDNYEGYLEDLRNIQAELEGLALHPDQGQAVEQYLRALFIQSEGDRTALSAAAYKLIKFQQQGHGQIQKNFYKVLLEPLLKVFAVISKDGLLNIEKDWRLEVVDPFNADLSQKFPFKDTQQEAALADFEHFFSPKKGKIAQFLETRLNCFVQESKGRTIAKRWMGESVPIGSKFFSGIEHAKIFSQGLFNQKSGEIEIKLQLFPDPSPHFSEFAIEVNGVSHGYQNDPEEWKLLDWPGQSSYPKSMFSATSISPRFKFFETRSGEWSFFRLLKQYANWNKISPGNYRVSFKFETDKKDGVDSSISFKLKTDTKVDFFKMIEISGFEMVDSVYGRS